jgi:hypothetical protein
VFCGSREVTTGTFKIPGSQDRFENPVPSGGYQPGLDGSGAMNLAGDEVVAVSREELVQ